MARPKSEDKKQALLEAATAAFAQSGIAASTSAIARSAGVAEGTLFRYFATKDELLNELYLAIKLRLVRTMIAGLDPDEKRPKENVPAVGERDIPQRGVPRLWRRPVSVAGGNHHRIRQPRSAARPGDYRPRL